MKKFNAKIPVLGLGLAFSAMQQLLTQIRHQHGLIRFIQRNGVNGRWLRADEPYDIHISRFFQIVRIKAHYQTDDEFLDDWNKLGEEILDEARDYYKSLYQKIND